VDTNSNSPTNNGSNAPNACAECERLRSINADLLSACRRALHLVEENNEEVTEMVGAFGLHFDLRNAILKATGEQP